MEKKQLKQVKNGEWFTFKPIEEPTEHQVYIRYDYDRSEKKYMYGHWDDVNDCHHANGTRTVYVGFTF